MLRFLLVFLAVVTVAVVALVLLAIGAAAFGLLVGAQRLRGRVGVPSFRRRKPEAVPFDPLEDAWLSAAREADWAASRIAVARTSCARILSIADANPLDHDAADWANVVRRRVPDLVAACVEECRDATPAERQRHLTDLVESLEKIGAEADRRRDRFRETSGSNFSVQRTYVDQRTRPDPLG